jgi:transcriptional regulator with XRE-family HTH domain
MSNNRDIQKLSLTVVEDLKGKGYSQSDIAEMFGVTRQWVSLIKHKYGGSKTPREIVLEAWPFEVPAQLSQCAPYKNLRNHGEYVETGGKGMSDDQLKRLRGFYKKLREENLVVEYDPNIPPIPGVSSVGGWAYRGRLKSDGDLLIRDNDHTNISKEGRMIWRFPPRDP